MSKVVKSVGRAIGKVVKGAVNVVKKVAKSPIGKALMIAGAVYFGGAALSGAMSSTSTAMTGISNAWSSLGQAATQAMGGNFAAAGEALGTGFGGGAASSVASPTSLVNPIASASGAADTAFAGATETGLATVPSDAANVLSKVAPKKGLLDSMMSSPYTAPMLINSGTQLVGGLMQAKGQQEQDEKAQARYNRNVGTRLYA